MSVLVQVLRHRKGGQAQAQEFSHWRSGAVAGRVAQNEKVTPMTPETAKYALIMLAAGVGVPVLAALNAQLGARIASPAVAGAMMFVIAAVVALGVGAALGQANALAALSAQPRYLFLAGLLIAFYLLSISWVAPRFGVGNAVMFVLLGQIIAICVIDQFGLFGARVRPLDWPRLMGIVLMAAGVVLAQRPPT